MTLLLFFMMPNFSRKSCSIGLFCLFVAKSALAVLRRNLLLWKTYSFPRKIAYFAHLILCFAFCQKNEKKAQYEDSSNEDSMIPLFFDRELRSEVLKEALFFSFFYLTSISFFCVYLSHKVVFHLHKLSFTGKRLSLVLKKNLACVALV